MQKTILVIDDDPVNLLTAKKQLQQQQNTEYEYKVIAMNSGKTMLRYLSTHTPDLILLDIMMPEIDGFELMDQLQANPLWKSIPVIFLTADQSIETEERCFKAGAMDFILKPFKDVILNSRIKHALEISDARNNLEHRIVQMQSSIITSIANLIESRDGTTGEHVKRTRNYVEYIVQKMLQKGIYTDKLTPHFISLLIAAAPLHDIGKVKIPDRILQKPGIYTAEERAEMQKHAAIGGALIKNNMSELQEKAFVDMAFDIATYHHERWNGNGYPTGKKEFEIPLSARIMAIADVFDALTSKRSYKDCIKFEEAISIMQKGNGTDFEPCIIEAFLADKEELCNLTRKLQDRTYGRS